MIRRTTWALAGITIVTALMLACRNESARREGNGPVDLLIDFNGRGNNKQFQVAWRTGLTAFNILEELQDDGKLTIVSRGTESQTLLTAIDGLENLWSAGDNWIFVVNDKLGNRSSAVFELQPGDRLVWRFGKYPPD